MVGMPKLNGRCTQGGLWLKDLAMRDGSAGTPFCTHQAADESGTVKPGIQMISLALCVYIHIYIYTYTYIDIHTGAHTHTHRHTWPPPLHLAKDPAQLSDLHGHFEGLRWGESMERRSGSEWWCHLVELWCDLCITMYSVFIFNIWSS